VLCLHGKGKGLISAVRSVQLLGGSIVVSSMWKLELGLVGWRQVRQAARREGHRQSDGNREAASRQTLQGVQSKECMPRMVGKLKSAPCCGQSYIRLRRCCTSRKLPGHTLDRGDWTQLKTPIVAAGGVR
jgi:hypothetical protein